LRGFDIKRVNALHSQEKWRRDAAPFDIIRMLGRGLNSV